MKLALLIVLAIAVSAAAIQDIPAGLKKPVILAGGVYRQNLNDAIKAIHDVLVLEPTAATANLKEKLALDFTTEDSNAKDDVDLLGSDHCPGDSESGEKCEDDLNLENSDSAAGTSSASSEDELEGSHGSSRTAEQQLQRADGQAATIEQQLQAGSSLSSTETLMQKQIQELRSTIKNALALSKALPSKIQQLESLEHQEQRLSEARAVEEAEKTLAEHEKLNTELDKHIQALKLKLQELEHKKSLLKQTDDRLRAQIHSSQGSASSSESASDSQDSASASLDLDSQSSSESLPTNF